MVAFESLSLDGEVVATHEDIDDEGQSVSIVEKPASDIPKAELAQTGDTNNIVPLVCLAAAAALTTALALAHRRRGIEENNKGKEKYSEEADEEDASLDK